MEERWEVLDIEPGTTCKDWYEDGIRVLVMRGPSNLCAYVGIPKDHPLAGFEYDAVPIHCHGGLTFARLGDGALWPEGWYWYGWDYGHCDDAATYYFTELSRPAHLISGKRWTVAEVADEAKWVAWDFKKLATLAERIRAMRCPGHAPSEVA